MRKDKGFTLIELMIVVVIIGILAAIAIPNFIAMQNRAKEGSTKANMHTLQLDAEDYGVQNDGLYCASIGAGSPTNAGCLLTLPSSFKNPFSNTDNAWEDKAVSTGMVPTATIPGVVAYADSSQTSYIVRGEGKSAVLSLVLSSGQ